MSVFLIAMPLTPQVSLDEAAFARGCTALRARARHGERTLLYGQTRLWLGLTHAGESFERVHAADDAGAVCFDGRFDAPAQVRAEFDAGKADAAALALAAWRHDGEHAVARMPGAWAMAYLDARGSELVCARDRLGQRPLYYACARDMLVVASDELAVLAASGLAPTPDPAAVAAHFAVRPPPPGRTFFTSVYEVQPGTVLRVRPPRITTVAVPARWSALPALRHDHDWAALWRDTLGTVVRDALVDARAPVLGLSGGLDSATIAAFARGTTLRALSWSLPGLSCDERAWSDAIAAHTGVPITHFDASAHWPLAPGSEFGSAHAPLANPFRGLKQAWYARAQEMGATTAVWGNFGDHLYPDRAWWLLADLRRGRWRGLVHELVALWRDGGLAAWRRDAGVRAPAKALLGRMREQPPAWLSPYACAQLIEPAAESDLAATPLPRLARVLVGPMAAWDAAGETIWSDRMGLDLRHPYRDWRLIELALATPVSVQSTRQETKALLRAAVRDLLPETVRARPKSGSLVPFFRRGVRELAHKIAAENLFNKGARWSEYVRVDAVKNAWESLQPSESQDLLIWQCLAYERWLGHLSGR
jgi:asparagine synthase (glutamine-hydrolysing)